MEQANIPDDYERYQAYILALEPFFNEYKLASTIPELNKHMSNTIQYMKEYEKTHQLNDESLTWKVAGVVAAKYDNHKDRIQTQLQQISGAFKFQSSQMN